MQVANGGARAPHSSRHHQVAVTAIALGLLFVGLVAGAITSAAGQSQGRGETVRDEYLELKVQRRGEWWTVAINIFVLDPGDGSFKSRAAEARRSMLARFKGAVEVEGSETQEFVLASYRWASRTAAWAYNPAGKRAGLSGDHQAIQEAAGIWNGAGSTFRFTGGELTLAGTGACTDVDGLDSLNTVGWKTQADWILAVTCTWFTQSGFAVEFDVELDPRWSWTTSSPVTVDLKTVMAHEFGHALGLGHTAGPCPGALMCPTYSSGATQHTLHPDDVAGLRALYGQFSHFSVLPLVAADKSTW